MGQYNRKVTPEMGASIKKRINEGWEYQEIAEEVGLTKKAISDFVEREVVKAYMKVSRGPQNN